MRIPEELDQDRRSQALTRRDFLVAVGAVSLLAACQGKAPVLASSVLSPAITNAAFLRLSYALTGKRDLNPSIAGRIDQAFATLQPDLHAQFPALTALTERVAGPQALLAAAGSAKPAALAIISAWYTGTVGKGVEAVTVAYRDALMQRSVDDGLFPPTYAQGGPGWWTAAPPAPLRTPA